MDGGSARIGRGVSLSFAGDASSLGHRKEVILEHDVLRWFGKRGIADGLEEISTKGI